ncbi:hypothetical protein ACNF49_29030 [Actinomadura sp. ATCC 39365]
MTDIGYFDAWGLWLHGSSTLGNDLLGLPWPVSLRGAVAFVMGLTDVPWYLGSLLGSTLDGAAGLLASWPCR